VQGNADVAMVYTCSLCPWDWELPDGYGIYPEGNVFEDVYKDVPGNKPPSAGRPIGATTKVRSYEHVKDYLKIDWQQWIPESQRTPAPPVEPAPELTPVPLSFELPN
jgi:hypothetical protein